MTIHEIKTRVAALCSQGSLTSEKVFVSALSTALDEIGRRFPKKVWETVCHIMPTVRVASDRSVFVTPNTPLTISGNGISAFSLTAYGKGMVSAVIDGSPVLTLPIAQNEPLTVKNTVSALADLTTAEVTLHVTSESRLCLSAFALYSSACSEVPTYCPHVSYPVSRFAHRFADFSGKIKKDGLSIENSRDVRLGDGEVLIAFDKNGLYEIEYEALPDPITGAFGEITLLREGAEILLPLLTAYYYAKENLNENADIFLQRYEALCQSFETGKPQNETVQDVYGW